MQTTDPAPAADPQPAPDDVDDAGGTGGPDPPEDARRARTGWSRLWRALPWVIAVLAITAAAVAGWQWWQAEQREAARTDVRVAATSFLDELTNWEAAGGLDETREALRAAGTGPFLEEVDEFFTTLTGRLSGDVTSEGEVQNVYVQELTGDTAEVFAVVLQTIEAEGAETRSVRRSVIDLQRVDGTWLVSQIRLLSDEAPAGTPDGGAGSGGGTQEGPDG